MKNSILDPAHYATQTIVEMVWQKDVRKLTRAIRQLTELLEKLSKDEGK